MERSYNPVRLHSGLGYRSPITYAAQKEAAPTEPSPEGPQTVHENGANLYQRPKHLTLVAIGVPLASAF